MAKCLESSTSDQLFLISVGLNPARYFGIFFMRGRGVLVRNPGNPVTV